VAQAECADAFRPDTSFTYNDGFPLACLLQLSPRYMGAARRRPVGGSRPVCATLLAAAAGYVQHSTATVPPLLRLPVAARAGGLAACVRRRWVEPDARTGRRWGLRKGVEVPGRTECRARKQTTRPLHHGAMRSIDRSIIQSGRNNTCFINRIKCSSFYTRYFVYRSVLPCHKTGDRLNRENQNDGSNGGASALDVHDRLLQSHGGVLPSLMMPCFFVGCCVAVSVSDCEVRAAAGSCCRRGRDAPVAVGSFSPPSGKDKHSHDAYNPTIRYVSVPPCCRFTRRHKSAVGPPPPPPPPPSAASNCCRGPFTWAASSPP
jgi:hypothetical protein